MKEVVWLSAWFVVGAAIGGILTVASYNTGVAIVVIAAVCTVAIVISKWRH